MLKEGIKHINILDCNGSGVYDFKEVDPYWKVINNIIKLYIQNLIDASFVSWILKNIAEKGKIINAVNSKFLRKNSYNPKTVLSSNILDDANR